MRQFAETGVVALDLANTWDAWLDDPERLPDVAALARFCHELGEPAMLTAADLDAVRRVRTRLRDVLAHDTPELRTRALARWSAELPITATVEDHDGTPRLHLIADPERGRAPLAARLAVRAVADLLDLAASGDWDRLRLCAARPCQDAFVDRSRPGRRQFCSTRCANRAHAAASRARHRA
ncbi:CGNR zinc finger [Nonomuraea coxensis DSM 45129]|uniref:CGNR zinc finger n=1 Tax=Nonomuraea coxensis DSM 45129 TaxID=1122611 RepID=A0ABX8TVX4_9ACTN|nr:CGNR zinc finger domain-containing protein [Nonomuraea coxensis]QYC39099.1 CGNR zinc finger [Nonomuraea coxensis DSM 45129]